jgi:hypothetical protein
MSKLFSRKLGVTLMAMITTLLAHSTGTQQIIVGAIAAIYVMAQSLIDHKTVDSVANAITDGIIEGQQAVIIPPKD